MTDEQKALSRRAVACKGWRWMPGMLAHFEHDGRYTRVSMPDAWFSTTALPDLSDPATLGCLLALVREAYGPRCYTQACGGFWTVQNEDTEYWWGKNCVYEVEALVAALEAAP